MICDKCGMEYDPTGLHICDGFVGWTQIGSRGGVVITGQPMTVWNPPPDPLPLLRDLTDAIRRANETPEGRALVAALRAALGEAETGDRDERA